jgi:acid phosphatase
VDEHGHAVLRLSMGRLLDILLANMETAAAAAAAAAGQAGSSSSSSSHAKLMMFSGHDSTIMPLLTGTWRSK